MRIKENVKPLNTKLCNQIDLKQEGKLGQCGAGIYWIGRKVHTKETQENTMHLVLKCLFCSNGGTN